MGDKFSIIPAGRLPSPAKCWSCGAGDRDCIDWGADIAFQGAILLCVFCVAEAFKELPVEPDYEKDQLRAQLKTVTGVLEKLNGDLTGIVNGAVRDIRSARMEPVPEFAGRSSLRK